MAVGDLAADRQPDAGTGIFVAPVQSLKDPEDSLEVFFFKAYAVVGDGDTAVFPAIDKFSLHPDERCNPRDGEI